ncbi:MAG: two-component regulator propeller domain-containing protein [Bacteroidales bacterium]|nr:two-component regulator propeller domain-containing protein [Bacteroidales bacterium]
MKRFLFIYLFLSLSILSFSQDDFKIGDWRGHFPYNSMKSVTKDKENIYAASEYSLFSYNVNTGYIDISSKISGLSDIGISCIKYNSDMNLLFVAYSNANIDIIKNGHTINMADIYRSNIINRKSINNIFFKDNYAYLSCGFGIVVVYFKKIEIADTYIIGGEGQYVDIHDFVYYPETNMFYASSDDGIYQALNDETVNLANYSNWSLMDIPVIESNLINQMEVFNNKIIANAYSEEYNQDTLLIYDGNEWSLFPDVYNHMTVSSLTAEDKELIICFNVATFVYDVNYNRIKNSWQYNTTGATPSPMQAIKGFNDEYWVADNKYGLTKFVEGWEGNFVSPSGPVVAQAFKMVSAFSNVYVVPGGFNVSWTPLYTQAKYSIFSSNEWSSVTKDELPGLQNITDLVDLAVDPRDANHIFLASYLHGLIELKDNAIVNVYNQSNSPLEAPNGYEDANVRVGGLKYDDNNNLWISNSLSSNMLYVLTKDNTWGQITVPTSFADKEVSDIIIDTYGQKWLKTRSASTIYVINDNGTPTYGGDDRCKALTYATGNGAIPGQTVSAIAVDKDGEVWIGTDQGIAVFYSPNNIFGSGDYDASYILVDYDGTTRPLLEGESITAIAVDYGNNKWIGTATSGVYYVSADGTEELAHYTKDNSSLLANSITYITINQVGEVFFGTSSGICSFRSTSSEPQQSNDSIYAYPNPVRPDYNGVIAVTGLMENSMVKITDMAGKIVFADRSNGGQVTWNGYTPNGKRAATGVYIVFVVAEDGTEKATTKILFIR